LLSLKLANKAEATVSKYRSILEKFLMECSISIDDLTSDDVLNWLKLYSIEKKERSLDQVISTLSSFFNFCLAEEYLNTMLMKKRWRPKIPQSLTAAADKAILPIDITKLSTGANNIVITVTDAVGNVSTPLTVTVTK